MRNGSIKQVQTLMRVGNELVRFAQGFKHVLTCDPQGLLDALRGKHGNCAYLFRIHANNYRLACIGVGLGHDAFAPVSGNSLWETNSCGHPNAT